MLKDRLISLEELSAASGISIYYLRKLVRLGEIPSIRLGAGKNSRIKIRESEYEKWVKTKEARSTSKEIYRRTVK